MEYTEIKESVERSEAEIILYLIDYNIWHSVFIFLMVLFGSLFILGPILDSLVAITVWVYIDLKSASSVTRVSRTDIVDEANQV